MPKGTPVSKSETGAFFLSSFHSCVLFKGLKRGIADHVFHFAGILRGSGLIHAQGH